MKNDERKLKQIPYGVSNFLNLQTRHFYYVDKTRYIPILEDKGLYLFLIRPRRFGKSLFLSTLELYYDVQEKEHFDVIFNGTYIQQNATNERNSYLVFKLDFSAVDANSRNSEDAFFKHIKKKVLSFLKKYKKELGVNLAEVKKELDDTRSAAVLMDVFLGYCQESGQKLYVIIDEYDNFANTMIATTGTQEYLNITHGEGFLRAFFNVLKSGTSGADAPIARLFMTGVSPITLDDVTSGFNIATHITLHSDLNQMLGFSREDVETMIEYYRQSGKIKHSTPELLQLMSAWYNHYCFSLNAEHEVFNPVQVLYFLSEYLVDSKIPETLVDHNVRIDYQKLRHLIIIDKKGKAEMNGNFSRLQEIIENESIQTNLQKSFPINKLTASENFVSLLFYFGLLTITGQTPGHQVILSIPNETIKRLFYDYIRETYEEAGLFTLNLDEYTKYMNGMAFEGQWQPLIQYIAERMAASTQLRDYISGEKVVQTFLNVYLGLSVLYSVYSEKELNKGFVDLVMEPRLLEYPTLRYSYLIEFKYLKAAAGNCGEALSPELSEKIKTLRLEAEKQLNEYALDERLQKGIGQTRLLKLVLIFCGHRLVYSEAL